MQGTVYQRIMEDVIENCQTTFEEEGVSQQTLEDLRSVGVPFSFAPSLYHTTSQHHLEDFKRLFIPRKKLEALDLPQLLLRC